MGGEDIGVQRGAHQQRLGPLAELVGELRLWAAAARNQKLLLQQANNTHTQQQQERVGAGRGVEGRRRVPPLVSGAPRAGLMKVTPPHTTVHSTTVRHPRTCTRQRTTQSASCSERSASSSAILLDPRSSTVAVRPRASIPVTLITLPPLPSCAGGKWWWDQGNGAGSSQRGGGGLGMERCGTLRSHSPFPADPSSKQQQHPGN